MLHFTKLLICPFRRNSDGGPGVDSAYALLLVMMVATVVLIGLTVALPSIYHEGQREREEELIFRGTQYARAIATFHQKFQRYPTSIQELTKLTNGWRFLRKEFADPMTPNGKWRFIHANAQGVLLDSKTQGPPQGGPGQPSAGQGAVGFGMSGPSSTGGSGFGQQSMGGSGFGQQGMGGSGFGQQGMGGSGSGQQGMGASGFGQQGGGGSGFGQSTGSFSPGSNPGESTSNAQQNSAFFGEGNQGGGIYIVGVASTSHKQSIRIWNKKTHYDEWEFIGVDLGALGIMTSIPGLPQGVGEQPGQGSQPNTFGQPAQGNPMMPGQQQGMFPGSGGSTSSPQ
jgi:type II secretory pathway pseudopilin PulG